MTKVITIKEKKSQRQRQFETRDLANVYIEKKKKQGHKILEIKEE
jgi:hypothetical protein